MISQGQDIGLVLANRPGSLAEFGDTLGAAGVSLDGGGVFTHESTAVAHFLVSDGYAAKEALERAGLRPVAVRDVVTLELHQGVPGQLGLISRRMAEAEVNIEIQYSDHDHRLILVVPPEQCERAQAVAKQWMEQR